MTLPLFHYRVHGLTIASELELPELLPASGTADVTIRIGEVPESLEGPVKRGPCYQATAGNCLIGLPKVARYWVRDGIDVIVAPAPGASDRDVRVFVLSSVMGALAHQRGLLAMHASAVEIDGKAVLFIGESGAGKSTLTAACHDRGHAVLTDDLTIVTFDEAGDPVVQPGYRHIKLWADSLRAVGHSLGAREAVRVGMHKFRAAVPGPPRSEPLRVSHVFLLSTQRADRIRIEPLTGREKLTALLRETYRRRMWQVLGRREAQFAQGTGLASRARMARVLRPADLSRVPAVLDTIEDHIRTAR